MDWFRRRAHAWMIVPIVAAAALAHQVTGLPGYSWLVVYGGAAFLIACVITAMLAREGHPVGRREDFTHGRDMHGHY